MPPDLYRRIDGLDIPLCHPDELPALGVPGHEVFDAERPLDGRMDHREQHRADLHADPFPIRFLRPRVGVWCALGASSASPSSTVCHLDS